VKYRELYEVLRAQEERRLAQEALPAHEWSVKRDALLASGLVEERKAARNAEERAA